MGDNNSQVRSVLLELFKNNLSPKPQRTHRDNNRGATLKRLQKTSLKRSESDDKVKDSNVSSPIPAATSLHRPPLSNIPLGPVVGAIRQSQTPVTRQMVLLASKEQK